MDKTLRRRAAGAIALGCAALSGLSGPSCGGDTEADRSPSDGAPPDANVVDGSWDTGIESSSEADSAAGCQHRDECDVGGAICENACGLPCTCEFFVTRFEWRCYLPVSGSFCDPKKNGSCFYPPDTQTDGKTCKCAPLSDEHVWFNCSNETVCPTAAPEDLASCSAFAAGIQCSYPLEGGLDRTCECKLAGSEKAWSCFPP